MKILFLMIPVLIFSGCIGTVATRTGSHGNNTDAFGSYPFKAVVVDVNLITSKSEIDGAGGELGFLGLVSIPVDLVVDAVLSPVDLILWPFGFKKSN